ncbi:MAG: RNA polymerase sigma factor SigZ [Nitrospirae bacterium]|nr:RNA polymerase sigma factor SigZ [Nitrospirota bacterium]
MARETKAIWEEFQGRLKAFIARRVRDEADAEDILQNVFVRIHRHIGAVNKADRLVSWLFQVSRNAVMDHYRAKARQREVPAGSAAELEAAESEESAARGGLREDDGESNSARRELSACLRPMMKRLPPHYRNAILLVELEGLSQREAADRFGLSLSGMKSRVQRGRGLLKKMLQDCCHIHLDAAGTVTDYEPKDSACGLCGSVARKKRP